MYTNLANFINEFKNKNTSLILIAGDFNAKVGKTKDNETQDTQEEYEITPDKV